MSLSPVRVAPDRWNFITAAGAYVSPIGGNMLNDQHPVQGTLFRNFNAADCERRLAAMQELGLNCLRQAIGVNEVFDPQAGLKPAGMKNWDTFIRLADKHGVYLMPVGGYVGGNDWFDIARLADNGRALEESCAFWRAFVGHYANHPAIWAWDLRNELLYDEQEHFVAEQAKPEARSVRAMLLDGWPAWLETKYGSVALLNRNYGSAYHAYADVPGSVRFVEQPFHPHAYDQRCYLNDRGYAWCKAQCDVIRAASPHHMICSGNNTWLSPDQNLWLANGFHNRAVHELFDFVTHHPYPAWQAVPDGRGDPLDGGAPLRYWLNSCIAMSRFEHYGKPVVIQEFGWYGGGASRFLCDLPHRSEQEHAHYMHTLITALEPHSNGFINWPLMDMPAANDISNHGGIFTHDGRPKVLAKVYRDLVKRTQGQPLRRQPATTTLNWSLLGLYTCRAELDRFFDACHELLEAGQVPDIRFVA